jgi:hypothetical protein
MSSVEMTILDCGHPISQHSNCSTGYGIEKDGRKICYACCAERDKAQMRENGEIILYLMREQSTPWENDNLYTHYVTNWPNSLRIQCGVPKISKHNIAGTRYDVWFRFEGQNWHGVQYGENTQVCHCKRLKNDD